MIGYGSQIYIVIFNLNGSEIYRTKVTATSMTYAFCTRAIELKSQKVLSYMRSWFNVPPSTCFSHLLSF